MMNCQCTCCSTAGPPYPAGTFPIVRPTPIIPILPAPPVPDLPITATQGEIIAAFNTMLASMRSAGYLSYISR